ncbi:hypothetical protein [Parabacteroides gordonii]|jgi:chromosome segregation ATPase|uniref:hypothetical protein n=1 Tax=Parabacteroides gordonii TaxID=574930 RepID=UPI00241E0791|nr:hypothetical protein [Parabacteroides gordonii]
MESRAPIEALLKQMGETLNPDIKEEMKKAFPEAWSLAQNFFEAEGDDSKREAEEHTEYLEKRLDQLLIQCERQNEKISKQAGQIKSLRQTVRMLAEIVKRQQQDQEKKTGEIELLKEKVERLENEFESWKQTERHSLAEFLRLLEGYPASQNEDVNTLVLFLLKIFRTISEQERERLCHLGQKEPGPLVQFDEPVYKVSGNERVNIGK